MVRAVATQDVVAGAIVTELDLDVVEQVEELRVHRGGVAGAEVAEEMIELLQGRTLVLIADAVGDLDALVRVQVTEAQDARTVVIG